MTAARIRAQFPTSDGFGYQLKGCCRPPFVWASYNVSRYIGRHSSRENNVPYCSHYSSSNTVPIIQFHTCHPSHSMHLAFIRVCVCVCVFSSHFILDIKLVGRTSRGHTGGRSHRISHQPSSCGACLNFSRETYSAIFLSLVDRDVEFCVLTI